MKKSTALLLTLIMTLIVLTACDKAAVVNPDENASEIVVFAAASMTETLEEIEKSFVADHPNVKLTFNFDSSGTLKTQIEEGAVCDLFISAAQKQMNGLEEGGYIDTATRIELLENKVALCVAANSASGIKSYDDMKDHLEAGDILMAIGNADVPVGQYSQKIFSFYGVDETALAEKGVLSYGSNVKEVVTQIAEGSVDCGIIYQTDAYSADLTASDTATEEMCGRVIYPAAVLSGSKVHDQAAEFLRYLQSAEASAIFEKVGFSPLANQ